MPTRAPMATPNEYSPFRYPGGKNWFVPHVFAWLDRLPQRPALFIEPFAGGASVGLAVAASGRAEHVLLMEKSPEIANVWRMILGPQVTRLIDRVLDFQPTAEQIASLVAQASDDAVENAFRTLARNRLGRTRMLHPGEPLKLRKDKTSNAIFWCPRTLVERLHRVSGLANRVTLLEGDALSALPEYLSRRDCAVFLDPPYSVAHRASHRHYYLETGFDLAPLFAMLAVATAPFLMLCDDSTPTRQLALAHGLTLATAPRRTANRVHELVIAAEDSSLRRFGLPEAGSTGLKGWRTDA